MASAPGSGASEAATAPLSSAQTLLDDIFTKEFEARLSISPTDEAKAAALAALRDTLPLSLGAIMSSIGVAGRQPEPVKAFLTLVKAVWKSIRHRPRFTDLSPSMLSSSLWLSTLSQLFGAVCQLDVECRYSLVKGSLLVQMALQGIGDSAEPFPSLAPAHIDHLATLITWWGDEVCSKRWGVDGAWGPSPCNFAVGRHGMLATTPLFAVAKAGLAALVPLALEKGCSVNGDFSGSYDRTPAVYAMEAGHMDVVEALLAHGLDVCRPYKPSGPLALALFRLGKSRVGFLAGLLAKHPEIIYASCTSVLHTNLLAAAIASKDPAIVELALSAGAPLEYGHTENDGYVQSALEWALRLKNAPVLRVLITKGKVLDDWKHKYNEEALENISERLAHLACSCHPHNPHFRFRTALSPVYDPGALEALEMVLASGIVCPWDHSGNNSLVCMLYSLLKDTEKAHPFLAEEKDTLALLKRYHAAGFDVVNSASPSRRSAVDPDVGFPPELQHCAIEAGHPSVLDWCIDVLGVLVEPAAGSTRCSLLDFCLPYALQAGMGVECPMLLLEKYNARPSYPELPADFQPVVNLMRAIETYFDEEAMAVLDALIARDSSLFDLPCFVTGETVNLEDEETYCRNPLYALISDSRPYLLEFLLKKNLPGVKALANRPLESPYGTCTILQRLSFHGSWSCFEILFDHTEATVTDGARPDLDCVAGLIREAARRTGGDAPPRYLAAKVEARAQKELAAKAAAAGTSTNVFEEPATESVKRQAVASAGAGAGTGTSARRASDSDGNEDPT